MGTKVQIFLNRNERDSFFRGYVDGDPMTMAIEFEVEEVLKPGEMVFSTDIPNRCFEIFNIGSNDLARRYRDNGFRSLSVGDVVKIGSTQLAVGKYGWNAVPKSVNVVEYRRELVR